MNTKNSQKRLVIVSNRLPFTASEKSGKLMLKESPGGLVSGLKGYIENHQSNGNHEREYVWVGWPGATISESIKDELLAKSLNQFHSHPVFFTNSEMEAFYHGFCNKTIWPLFHYFPSYADYREEFWRQYIRVNEEFCKAVSGIVKSDDIIWIHDYHLMLLPKMLRAQFPNLPIGFFLHIPFPSFEVFRLLPVRWRIEILEGLLGADLTGFHTYEYTQHYLQSIVRMLGHESHLGQIMMPDRIVKTGTFPLGLDFAKYSNGANDPVVKKEAAQIKENFLSSKVILSVDRLDYSKGIINRLQGFEKLLEAYPQFRENVVLVMIVVPSRIGVEHYDAMKKQIEELVGRVNGMFGNMRWTPIVYQYRALSFSQLVALYSISDTALVTPLRDGMNLIAKEYIASREEQTGVLILSEMAGAAKELGEAIIINPNSTEEIAEALRESLEMMPEEQKRRNKIMQARLRRYNVDRWADEFVQELLGMVRTQSKFYAKVMPGLVKHRMVEEYDNADRPVIFLDYDGTLVPFARRPQLAKPGPDIINLLKSLTEDKKATFVLVSGRERETLQQWFGDLSLNLVAEHGIWIREVNQEWKMLHQYSNEWKSSIRPILEQYADRLPSSFVEEKDYSIAWHYRSADPEHGQSLVGEIMDHLVNYTANLNVQVLRGHKVIEVRNAGANKGSAALHWLSQDRYDFILACGDDWTDEDLFMALPKSAYSIRVGIANTHARYNIRDSREVINLLEQLKRPHVPATVLERQ